MIAFAVSTRVLKFAVIAGGTALFIAALVLLVDVRPAAALGVPVSSPSLPGQVPTPPAVPNPPVLPTAPALPGQSAPSPPPGGSNPPDPTPTTSASPVPVAAGQGGGGAPAPQGGKNNSGTSSGGPGSFGPASFTAIPGGLEFPLSDHFPFRPTGAVGATIEVGLVLLPLILGIWLLTFLRTVAEARRLRSRALRMSLAAELGISPRDLVGMSTKSLFALRDQVTFDDLTGVLRRVAGVAAVEREIHRARRHHSPLAVCFVDVDGLKATNDSKGHAEGDALLKKVSGLLTGSIRSSDTVFRYGGDEFVCVLPDCTGLDAEKNLKELAIKAVHQHCSFSFGVAQLEPFDDVVSLLGRADGVLYERRREQAAPGPILRRMVELGTRQPVAPQPTAASMKPADTAFGG